MDEDLLAQEYIHALDQCLPGSSPLRRESLEARSTMLGADALTALAEAESHLAQITDAIFRLDTGPAADFAGYVWFVLTAVEPATASAARPIRLRREAARP